MQEGTTDARPTVPFTNHLVFARVMRDPELAKGLLERILRIGIERVEYCNTEQTFDFDLDAKSVRLDLFVKDGARVFNVEMQTQDYADIGVRMAYYQAAINSDAIERGKKKYSLPESFIIFLCTDDPFGREAPRYTFDMACREEEGLVLRTRAHWMVLNAAAYEKEDDAGVRSLLKYVATQQGCAEDPLVEGIDERVRSLNRDKELMDMASMFMTYEEDAIARGELRGIRQGIEKGLAEGRAKGIAEGLAEGRAKGIAEGRAEGIAEGRAEGEERYAELAGALAKAKRFEDIERAASDRAFRAQLLQEFGIA